ncbi:NAD-binding protein, partial [Mycobacterium sp.]
MRVVVMGCGRVGSSVADGLSRIGHDVAVID